MPPLPPVPGVCQVVQNGTIAGVKWANVFYVSYSTPFISATGCQEVATAFRAAYVPKLIKYLTPRGSAGSLVVRDLASDTGPTGTASGSDVGISGGTDMGANCAIGVSWGINRHYRGGHPRTYLPGPTTVVLSSPNTITGAVVTQLKGDMQTFLAAVNAITTTGGATIALVCVHRYKNKVLLNPPLVDPIVSVSVDDRLDSQRRRLGRDR